MKQLNQLLINSIIERDFRLFGPQGARTLRSLGHQLLHPHISML
jgi:hypothetical protein